MTITVDRRKLKAEDDKAAREAAKSMQPGWLDQQLELARLLGRIDKKAAFTYAGCASIAEFASRHGYDPSFARQLSRVGWALAHDPAIEPFVRKGEIPLGSAAMLGELYRCPEYVRPNEEGWWLEQARFQPLRVLKRLVRERIEEVRQGKLVSTLSFQVTDETKRTFDDCQDLASRKAGKILSPSETFAQVVTDYRERHGAATRTGRRRRVGPTADRPQDRYVPVSVERALRRRSGGVCEIPGCEHRLRLERCHLRPHRLGSGREVWDLADLCSRHHTLYDAGLVTFAGWLDDGRPVFRGPDGKVWWPRPSSEEAGAGGAPARDPPPRPERTDGSGRVAERFVEYVATRAVA